MKTFLMDKLYRKAYTYPFKRRVKSHLPFASIIRRFNFYGSVHRKYIPIYVYIQQDATLHNLFITGNCSTCFGWYFHPSSGAVETVVCAPDDGWKYHPEHVEQFPDINKLCDVASCWVCEYIGILLGDHPILHISRINVKDLLLRTLFSNYFTLFYPNCRFQWPRDLRSRSAAARLLR